MREKSHGLVKIDFLFFFLDASLVSVEIFVKNLFRQKKISLKNDR